MKTLDWAGYFPATSGLPGKRCDDATCPACKGAGALQHDSRNPELIVDCSRCGGDGLVAA